jgi:hypothetical protein
MYYRVQIQDYQLKVVHPLRYGSSRYYVDNSVYPPQNRLLPVSEYARCSQMDISPFTYFVTTRIRGQFSFSLVWLRAWRFWSFLTVNGGLMMTKPDFSKMNRQELRTYVLTHRDDDEVIEALIKRGNPNSPKYRFPQTDEDLREMEELLRRKLSSSGEVV